MEIGGRLLCQLNEMYLKHENDGVQGARLIAHYLHATHTNKTPIPTKRPGGLCRRRLDGTLSVGM